MLWSKRWGTLGTPVAWIAVALIIGLAVIPLALETKSLPLPE